MLPAGEAIQKVTKGDISDGKKKRQLGETKHLVYTPHPDMALRRTRGGRAKVIQNAKKESSNTPTVLFASSLLWKRLHHESNTERQCEIFLLSITRVSYFRTRQ